MKSVGHMPRGFVPKGHPDNSPTFQHWGAVPLISFLPSRRDGRKPRPIFNRPEGTDALLMVGYPTLKTLGYSRQPLRGKNMGCLALLIAPEKKGFLDF